MNTNFLDEWYNKDIQTKVNSKGETTWNQTYRNNLRDELVEYLLSNIQEILGQNYEDKIHKVEAIPVDSGIMLLIPHREYGVIPVTLGVKIHQLSYDYDLAIDDFNDKIEKKLAKQEKKLNEK